MNHDLPYLLVSPVSDLPGRFDGSLSPFPRIALAGGCRDMPVRCYPL